MGNNQAFTAFEAGDTCEGGERVTISRDDLSILEALNRLKWVEPPIGLDIRYHYLYSRGLLARRDGRTNSERRLDQPIFWLYRLTLAGKTEMDKVYYDNPPRPRRRLAPAGAAERKRD